MAKQTAIACLAVAAAAAPAAAEDRAPASLHMRDDSAPPSVDDGKTEVITLTGSTVEHG